MTPGFDSLTSPFLHKYPVCLGFASWLMRLGLISTLRGHLKIMWFSGTQTHTHIIYISSRFQCGVEFFGLSGTNLILGVFNLTKMHLLLMQDRGEIKTHCEIQWQKLHSFIFLPRIFSLVPAGSKTLRTQQQGLHDWKQTFASSRTR